MTSNSELTAARKPLEQYIKGHQTRHADVMRAAFLPSAHVEGMRADGFNSWDMDAYCGFFVVFPQQTNHNVSAQSNRSTSTKPWLRHA
jgi:Putative lumazine-binding